MTREDAIKMLKYNSNVIHQTINGGTDPKEVEALDMAIKALEQERSRLAQITQYRNDCEKLMQENEQLKKALEQEPTTKNDLEVDCISRADAIKAMQNKAKKLKNEDTINGLCGAVAILYEMPPVTPQEPKTGHWKLVQRGKSIDICCSNCEKVRIKQYSYNYTIDQLDKEDLEECFECADMRYCPNCGARMIELQERSNKE